MGLFLLGLVAPWPPLTRRCRICVLRFAGTRDAFEAVFRMLDHDSDKTISLAEFIAVFGKDSPANPATAAHAAAAPLSYKAALTGGRSELPALTSTTNPQAAMATFALNLGLLTSMPSKATPLPAWASLSPMTIAPSAMLALPAPPTPPALPAPPAPLGASNGADDAADDLVARAISKAIEQVGERDVSSLVDRAIDAALALDGARTQRTSADEIERTVADLVERAVDEAMSGGVPPTHPPRTSKSDDPLTQLADEITEAAFAAALAATHNITSTASSNAAPPAATVVVSASARAAAAARARTQQSVPQLSVPSSSAEVVDAEDGNLLKKIFNAPFWAKLFTGKEGEEGGEASGDGGGQAYGHAAAQRRLNKALAESPSASALKVHSATPGVVAVEGGISPGTNTSNRASLERVRASQEDLRV